MQKLKKLLYLLTNHERKRAILLLVMILFMALLDMIGVASIMPFIAVMTKPELVETNIILSTMYKTSSMFGVETNQQFLYALGIGVFLLLIISLTFKALTSYAQVRFTSMREYSIGKRLVEGYLHQPYSWFLNRHSADLGKTILSEVGLIVNKGFGSMINFISQCAVTISLLVLLILVDIKLTFIVFLTLGAAYGLMYKFSQNLVNQIGIKRLKANEWRFTILNEAFGAFKDVKVGGLEENYVKRFAVPAKTLAHQSALLSIISQFPRFALEAVAFGGIVLVVLYLMTKSDGIMSVMPLIALYAFAGYRLMPALQKIYVSLTELRVVGPSLDNIYDDLVNLSKNSKNDDINLLHFNKSISLKNVNYNYPNASKTALKNININISAQTTVGLVGATGSGKTTTADIILSLLEPQKGTIEVDDIIINNHNRRAWQNNIGYVPQEIFLSDDTISANIAFGVDPKKLI